jgi:hypothetical protein
VGYGVEGGCRPPALQAGHPRNGHNAVLGVARPQGVEVSGWVGPGETLGSPWIPLAIFLSLCFDKVTKNLLYYHKICMMQLMHPFSNDSKAFTDLDDTEECFFQLQIES